MDNVQDYLDYFKLPELTPQFKDVLILLAALLVLGLLLLSFARRAQEKPISSRSSRKSRSSSSKSSKELIGVEEQGDGKVRRKFRKRRRSHRPRNPSLSETGGLPPAKKDSDL